jgi:hypothetical protein
MPEVTFEEKTAGTGVQITTPLKTEGGIPYRVVLAGERATVLFDDGDIANFQGLPSRDADTVQTIASFVDWIKGRVREYIKDLLTGGGGGGGGTQTCIVVYDIDTDAKGVHLHARMVCTPQ